MILSKKVGIDAAHYLPNYSGKCANMHGHHWVVEVAVEGEVQDDGMILDFVELKRFLQSIEEEFDHKLLNLIITNPTAENICIYIRRKFDMWSWTRNIKFGYLKVWETEDSCSAILS